MSESLKVPQDIVAIFHASFHPTQGNVIDWSLKASADLNLDNLEFNALPSGLHLVEQDVVYFNKDGHHGVCVFRRRSTDEPGHRGVRLSSLGILLAKAQRPKPWRHVEALKDVIGTIYSKVELSGNGLQPSGDDWKPAREFFEQRQVRRADLGGAGDWMGWSYELDGDEDLHLNPALHLPHLLRILGPSSLTLHKYILGRKRILIFTLPPVEAACLLCQVAGDIGFEVQVDEVVSPAAGSSTSARERLKGRYTEGINVLGMITLSDLDRLEAESRTGRGWIACTTDAIFLEKPSHYDLLIDLTTSTPNKATRPTFYASQPIPPSNSSPSRSGPTHRLSTIRFAWSDVKLWNELSRILQLDTSACLAAECCGHPASDQKPKLITAWTDVWQVYEDVCVICAGLWMGSWRGNSTVSYSTANPKSWGGVRLEGDDDLTLGSMMSGSSGPGNISPGHVRNLGQGIEGRPPTNKAMRRTSAMSWSSSKATVTNHNANEASTSSGKMSRMSTAVDPDPAHDAELEIQKQRRESQLLTTLALLQTFHAHTLFQLSTLERFLPQRNQLHRSLTVPGAGGDVITINARDMVAFELGPFSSLDAKYLEWLAAEYGGGLRVVVKRSWRDVFGLVLGY